MFNIHHCYPVLQKNGTLLNIMNKISVRNKREIASKHNFLIVLDMHLIFATGPEATNNQSSFGKNNFLYIML